MSEEEKTTFQKSHDDGDGRIRISHGSYSRDLKDEISAERTTKTKKKKKKMMMMMMMKVEEEEEVQSEWGRKK